MRYPTSNTRLHTILSECFSTSSQDVMLCNNPFGKTVRVNRQRVVACAAYVRTFLYELDYGPRPFTYFLDRLSDIGFENTVMLFTVANALGYIDIGEPAHGAVSDVLSVTVIHSVINSDRSKENNKQRRNTRARNKIKEWNKRH